MTGNRIAVDPDVVAGLGNDMYSISMRLRSKPSTVGASTLPALGRAAGNGTSLDQTYADVAQSAMKASDALCGSLETNGQYVLAAAQDADEATG